MGRGIDYSHAVDMITTTSRDAVEKKCVSLDNERIRQTPLDCQDDDALILSGDFIYIGAGRRRNNIDDHVIPSSNIH